MRNSTTQPRGLRAALIAGGLALVLTTAACGSDTGTGAGGTSAPATSAPATSAAATSSSASDTASAGTSAPSSPESSDSVSSGSESSGSESSGSESSSSGSAPASIPMTGPAPTALTADEIAAAKKTLADQATLTVCTSLPYQPFEVDDGSGKIVGFDIDFMDALAKNLGGLGVKVIDAKFDGIQSGQAMESKTCDIGAAAMTITEERAANILFSDPYYDASQGLLVSADSGITDISGLQGKVLAAQSGTTGLKYANANAAKYGYTVVEVEKISDEQQAVTSGTAQGAIQDLPALKEVEKSTSGSLKVVQGFNTGEQYGFGMAKENTALTAVVNYTIKNMQADGSYTASYAKWIDPGQG